MKHLSVVLLLLCAPMAWPAPELEGGAKACVASLVLDEEFNYRVREQTAELLSDMGYATPDARVDFKSGTRGLKDCIEGAYEEVILLSHSSEVVEGHQSLVVETQRQEGRGWQVLHARLFERVQASPSLRQITLVTCHPYEVLEEYPELQRMADARGISIRIPPISITAAWLSAGALAGTRGQWLIPYLIAEAAQDENASTIYCLVRTRLVGLVETGASRCLRNRFELQYRAYLAVGLKTSTRFVAVNGRSQVAILDLEAAFVNGAHLAAGSDPVSVSHDSYGLSVSLFPVVSLQPR